MSNPEWLDEILGETKRPNLGAEWAYRKSRRRLPTDWRGVPKTNGSIPSTAEEWEALQSALWSATMSVLARVSDTSRRAVAAALGERKAVPEDWMNYAHPYVRGEPSSPFRVRLYW